MQRLTFACNVIRVLGAARPGRAGLDSDLVSVQLSEVTDAGPQSSRRAATHGPRYSMRRAPCIGCWRGAGGTPQGGLDKHGSPGSPQNPESLQNPTKITG